jgi:hypothetical protein
MMRKLVLPHAPKWLYVQLLQVSYSPSWSARQLCRTTHVLDASALQDARNIVLKARNTLVEAQAAFDAQDDAKAHELFDKVAELTKKANKTLAEAARKAILEHEAAPTSASSSAESTPQPAQADESPGGTR